MTAAATETEAHALYRFFAADGALLYVGISMNPAARWGQHRSEKHWWTEVAMISLERHTSREEAERAEVVAIRSESPRYNVMHHPDRWPAREGVLHDGPYMGAWEIANLISVSRQRVAQLVKHSEFPSPAAVLSMGSVWLTKDVLAWAEKTGRKLYE